MHDFTPISALIGGGLIGLAASILLIASGRIAGISGIVGGILNRTSGDVLLPALFVLRFFVELIEERFHALPKVAGNLIPFFLGLDQAVEKEFARLVMGS